jgi:DNA N-6-adenine-methyltransferase (Dam)
MNPRTVVTDDVAEYTLQKTDAEFCAWREEKAATIERIQATATLKVARELAEVHQQYLYRRDEGGFRGWVENRLGMSKSTAYSLLNVHKTFGGNVSAALDTLPRKVLYLLASPSTPESACDIVIERAETGEQLSHRDVQEIIAEHKLTSDVPSLIAAYRQFSNYEWGTPPEYIKASREVLGHIDLDPASSKTFQRTVQAAKFFTTQTNGLLQPWRGRAFLNPPYAHPLMSQFVGKLIKDFHAGNVTAAILLGPNSTDTEWFHEAAQVASAVCFVRGRIKFVDGNVGGGDRASPSQGSTFIYFGRDTARFHAVFSQFGMVVVPWVQAIPVADDLEAA